MAASPTPPPRRLFTLRLLQQTTLVLVILCTCLGIGVMGYHYFDHLNWVDSFFNAALMLADEGPNTPVHTDEAKIFVGLYGLFSVVVFLTTVSVILAPGIQRSLRRLNLDALSDLENN